MKMYTQNAKSEIKKIITIKHEFKNFPILRILTMNIKRIGAKLPKLNIRLEKRKKKNKRLLQF